MCASQPADPVTSDTRGFRHDAEAAASIAAVKNWRVVMPGDFVPHWPPSFITGVHIGEKQKLKPRSWWPGHISRHSIDGYVDQTAEV